MKYAITGHTNGIGKKIYDSLDPDVLGFSRSNGYDISSKSDRIRIITQILESDIFINNAYCNGYQTELLYEIYSVWKNQDKLIVNIGSNTTDGIKTFVHPYAAWKMSLEKASEQLSNLNSSCKVMLIKFGWVGSERVIKNYNPKKYISLDDACSFILNNIEWSKKYNLTSLTLLP